jgi:MoaA/NifB/PqqE/SkfB family radical SAM enzyme
MNDRFVGLRSLRRKVSLAAGFLKATGLPRKVPFCVGWCITHRCNLECVYCHSRRAPAPELTTEQISQSMISLYEAGTRIIRFTGGEPLLREDAGELIALSKHLGIWTSIATNGLLVPSRLEVLRKADSVIVSIDGPEEVHDALRGQGTYRQAREACRALSEAGIPLTIGTVITSLNAGGIEHVLDLGERFNAKVFFQPATPLVLFGSAANPVSLEPHEVFRVFERLRALKRSRRAIGNSKAALEYLMAPADVRLRCVAGRSFFRIEPNGDMHACLRSEPETLTPNILRQGVDECIRSVASRSCRDCRSGVLVEMNLLAQYHPSTILEAAQRFITGA